MSAEFSLLENVINVLRKEPEFEQSLLDSFSTPQVNAKFNIINHINFIKYIRTASLRGFVASLLLYTITPLLNQLRYLRMITFKMTTYKLRLIIAILIIHFLLYLY